MNQNTKTALKKPPTTNILFDRFKVRHLQDVGRDKYTLFGFAHANHDLLHKIKDSDIEYINKEATKFHVDTIRIFLGSLVLFPICGKLVTNAFWKGSHVNKLFDIPWLLHSTNLGIALFSSGYYGMNLLQEFNANLLALADKYNFGVNEYNEMMDSLKDHFNNGKMKEVVRDRSVIPIKIRFGPLIYTTLGYTFKMTEFAMEDDEFKDKDKGERLV
eukprot:TRINITY_DN3135_c0_g1_i2.p1 TRINITY_DN3135_c0_g1~~TRINITY_DN3135_c0_g1_i2.p1  ORF type:complete len:216 (-),score=51.37 TRINITY_DN3135_c0_g1_i2:346-993(-)